MLRLPVMHGEEGLIALHGTLWGHDSPSTNRGRRKRRNAGSATRGEDTRLGLAFCAQRRCNSVRLRRTNPVNVVLIAVGCVLMALASRDGSPTVAVTSISSLDPAQFSLWPAWSPCSSSGFMGPFRDRAPRARAARIAVHAGGPVKWDSSDAIYLGNRRGASVAGDLKWRRDCYGGRL